MGSSSHRRSRRHGQIALAHRARLRGTQKRTRPRPFRRAKLARLPSSRNPVHRRLWIPYPRTSGDSPLRPPAASNISYIHPSQTPRRRRSDPNGISKTRSRQSEDNSRSRWLEPSCAARVAKPSQLDHLCHNDHPAEDRRDTVELGSARHSRRRAAKGPGRSADWGEDHGSLRHRVLLGSVEHRTGSSCLLTLGVYALIWSRTLLRSEEFTMSTEISPRIEECTCLAVRQAARHITQFYDQFLAPIGLRTTQFSILAKLRRQGPMTINELADKLVMDRTTLGRNILPLERDGLIAVEQGSRDRRSKELRVTEAGEARFRAGVKGWVQAQRQFEKAFGAKRTTDMRAILHAVTAIELGTQAASAEK